MGAGGRAAIRQPDHYPVPVRESRLRRLFKSKVAGSSPQLPLKCLQICSFLPAWVQTAGKPRRVAVVTANPRRRMSGLPGRSSVRRRARSDELQSLSPQATVSAGIPHGSRALPVHTVRNATVGAMRDARTAGIRPANAPIRMAEAMPPVHAWAGITTARFFEVRRRRLPQRRRAHRRFRR